MIDGTVETRLAAISPELTAALAEAEKAVGQVEDFLKKCALNVWASVEISRQVSIEDDPEGWKDEVRGLSPYSSVNSVC